MEDSVDTKYLDNLNATDSEKYFIKLQKIENLSKMLERSTDDKIVDLLDELTNDIQILHVKNKYLYDSILGYEKKFKVMNDNIKKMTRIIKKHNETINHLQNKLLLHHKCND